MKESATLFGKRLRVARMKADVSQRQLGIQVGMDASVASARMNQYEVGSHSPKFQTATTIAAVLNVPTAYFYAEEQIVADAIVAFGRLSEKHNGKRRPLSSG